MAHWAATNKKDGRLLLVSDKNYDPEEWDLVKLSRKPTEFDDFDGAKLVKNKEREAKIKKAAAARSLSREDLVERIEALEAKVATLESQV